MKIVMAAFLLSLSLTSFAGGERPNGTLTGHIKPSTITCEELTARLETDGRIPVIYGALGFSRGTMYADERDAGGCINGRVRKMTLKTSDGKCEGGYICIRSGRNN